MLQASDVVIEGKFAEAEAIYGELWVQKVTDGCIKFNSTESLKGI